MAMIKCRECGKKISALAKACPACGYPLGEQIAPEGKVLGKRCIKCQAIIPIQADHCPRCSANQRGSAVNATVKSKKGLSQKQKVWLIIAIGAVLVWAVNGVSKIRSASQPTNVVTNSKVPTQVQQETVTTDPEKVKQGRELHLKILNRYKKLDKFYREPSINGGVTSTPSCVIAVPIEDWESLSAIERQALAHYTASLVSTVKAQPLKYSHIPVDAPIATKVYNNVVKMPDDAWGIVVGKITPDGKDIGTDRIEKP